MIENLLVQASMYVFGLVCFVLLEWVRVLLVDRDVSRVLGCTEEKD